jgi:hypothetical protein
MSKMSELDFRLREHCDDFGLNEVLTNRLVDNFLEYSTFSLDELEKMGTGAVEFEFSMILDCVEWDLTHDLY